MNDGDDMLARLLPFQRRIVEDLIEEDGLCILSAGMGWQKVVSICCICRKSVPSHDCQGRLRRQNKDAWA